MKVVLIGNYEPDGQESMKRFARMLEAGFQKREIVVHYWTPKVILGKPFSSTISGAGKWAGYIDKWLLFPFYLCMRRLQLQRENVHFHICDHSNAPYLKFLPKQNTVITCHDVIAIRAGLGYSGTYVAASRMGKILQKWILRHLQRASHLAAVSKLTLDQLEELSGESDAKKNWQVIHNGFNADFSPLKTEEAKTALLNAGIAPGEKFILHVGSDLPRKNRKLLLEMVAALGDQWSGKICFAGKGLEPNMIECAERFGLRNRVVSVVKPDHPTLQALYSLCEAFIFPSFSEGFGWPVIEAQACGAPVIASSIEPMPEIGGEGALYADPLKPAEFATAFLRLQSLAFRQEMVQRGFQNVHRFQPQTMIQKYLHLHGFTSYVSETY